MVGASYISSSCGSTSPGSGAVSSTLEMEYLMRTIASFLKDESGSNAAEYALIIALVAGVIAVAVALVGTNISKELSTIAGSI